MRFRRLTNAQMRWLVRFGFPGGAFCVQIGNVGIFVRRKPALAEWNHDA